MKEKTKVQETKVQKRLSAGMAPEAKVRSLGGAQANLNRLAKETEMNIEQREDVKLQPMGKNDELNATYDQLLALFDLPNAGPSPDGKIDVQWDLVVDGVKVSVWNWKDGQKYGGHISKITSWSVWAEDIDAVDALQEFFDDQGNIEADEATAEVYEYLDLLQESGETNMMGAGTYIVNQFDVSISIAKKLLAGWMETFDQRHGEGDRGIDEAEETEMLETVREEISHMNADTDGMFFYAVAEVLGRYIVRTLKSDGSLTEQTLKEFYKEITD